MDLHMLVRQNLKFSNIPVSVNMLFVFRKRKILFLTNYIGK